METKTYKLHFRTRLLTNYLDDVFVDCSAKSKAEAKRIGKGLEKTGPQYQFFMGVYNTEVR